MDDAKKRLINILPHLGIAFSMAKIQVPPDGKVCIGIIAKEADGGGRVTATFEAEQFFEDLVQVLGFKDFKDFLSQQAKIDA